MYCPRRYRVVSSSGVTGSSSPPGSDVKRNMAARKWALNSRDKEVQAITYNLKEQRVLEKTMQTLELEERYSLKLVGLSHREVKLHQRRLRAEMGAIQSHLNAQQILELKGLESDGKLDTSSNNTAHLGRILRIEAAEKRLKLGHGLDSPRKARSAHAPSRVTNTDMMSSVMRPKTACLTSRGRDTGDDEPQKRRKSSVGTMQTNSKTQTVGIRPSTSHYPADREPSKSKTRPKTAPGLDHIKISPETDVIQEDVTSPDTISSQVLLSERRRTNVKPRRVSVFSDCSMDSDLAKKYAAGVRRSLLDEEELAAVVLEERREDFLQRVSRWVRDSPSITANLDDLAPPPPEVKPFRTAARHNKTPDNVPSGSESSEKEEGINWKELQKCRYLRRAEADIDISGVNTLARDFTSVGRN